MRRIILSLLLHTLASVQAFVIVDSESAPKRYLSLKHRRAPLRTHHCQYGRSDALFPTAAAAAAASSSHGRLWAGISAQETNRSDEIEDNGGGWGFDVDDEVMAQAEREILDATTISASNFTVVGGAKTTKEERDLFIPIFTLVSIVGFAGLYAYELLRLYFAGELYLPFLH